NADGLGLKLESLEYPSVIEWWGIMKKYSEVRTDISSNRITITIRGRISRRTAEEIYSEIRFGVSDLQDNFVVITDLSQATFAYLDCIPCYLKIVRFLQSSQVGTIIRIIDSPKIIVRQLDRVASGIENYTPVYVSSFAEAESFMATLPVLQSSCSDL
ncbi:MAG: hypothetical protein V2I36_15700, partial [Desulfopila sp.]|nr:hypothetical protein [Desulfopila sp.]